MKKINFKILAKILMLAGIFIPLVSFIFITNYIPQAGLIFNVLNNDMQVYRYSVKVMCPQDANSLSEFMGVDSVESFLSQVECGSSSTYTQSRVATVPYRYILLLSLIFIIIGTSLIVFKKGN